MTNFRRTLGVDYGLARVGLALSDSVGITAQPLETIQRVSDAQGCDRLVELIDLHDVGEVVVGHPLEMSGKVGKSARLVEAFVACLRERVTCPVSLWDERLTTVQAERALDEGNVHWKKRKAVVDRIAAAVLLQSYLDRSDYLVD